MIVRNFTQEDLVYRIAGKKLVLKADDFTVVDETIVTPKALQAFFRENIQIFGRDKALVKKEKSLIQNLKDDTNDEVDLVMSKDGLIKITSKKVTAEPEEVKPEEEVKAEEPEETKPEKPEETKPEEPEEVKAEEESKATIKKDSKKVTKKNNKKNK